MPRLARLPAPAVFLLALSSLVPQASAADRVVTPVDSTRRVSLAGGRPAWATAQTDAGALPADSPIQHATIVLARSPERQRAFEQFLARQQDPGSSDYHRWLTPVEVGERFGVSTNEIAAVTAWLASENLQVETVSNSRVMIAFGGSAAAVGQAFGARLHQYVVNGEQRVSIASDPSIPAALAPVIRAVSGLYTVKLNPMHRGGAGSLAAPLPGSSPEGTFGSNHYLFPADFAAIYDLNSVYSSGLSGAGQTIAIIGRSRVDNADIENFQKLSGLPVQDPIVIVPPNGVDPGAPQTIQGTYTEDQLEATIDVTRAASVAPGATIDLVVSGESGHYDGLYLATQYVVDTNPVPARIMSLSFGACERGTAALGVALWDTFFSQAAAEGISVLVCSGDSGAAGCDDNFKAPPALQIQSPNYICSSSYATCVGGTEFADVSSPSQYWFVTNGTNYESALGYIPEGGWNEPLTSSGLPQIAAGGGGVSGYIATPAWQSGIAPGYQGRYTPDISFTSSCHDGYFACFAAAGNGCPGGTAQHFEYFCGTSASAPDMAGIAALINQKEGGPQGNLNPALYRLSLTARSVFHDVTVQSSGVANCDVNVPSMCNNSTPGPTGLTGGLAGFLVGPGYDEVTGLGSIDVANLLANWASVTTPLPGTAVTLTSSANTAAMGTTVTLTASVTSSDSILPLGTVSFVDGTATSGTATLGASGSATYNTTSLGAGVHSITAVYGGDVTHAGSTSAALAQAISPAGCTFGLNSASQVFPAAGGSGVVNVTAGAGCFWAASSPAGWVTLTAPASGAGSGVLNYTVTANSGGGRSGTLSVAGLPFNVQQSAEQPAISPSGILNAASFTADIAPGSLASLFGTNLADNTYQGSQVLDGNNHFLTSVAGVSVSVDGVNAPLIYVSPGQINFQVPWETPLSEAVKVQVTLDGAQSNIEPITLASTAAPSMFLNNYSTGVAWVTGGTAAEGCTRSQCTVQAGNVYTLWANGLGPKNITLQDGVGAPVAAVPVAGGYASCQLTIGGVAAQVDYCGAAPALIIDQLNFTYPAGVPPGAPVAAVLTINGASGTFWLPAPAAVASSPAVE